MIGNRAPEEVAGFQDGRGGGTMASSFSWRFDVGCRGQWKWSHAGEKTAWSAVVSGMGHGGEVVEAPPCALEPRIRNVCVVLNNDARFKPTMPPPRSQAPSLMAKSTLIHELPTSTQSILTINENFKVTKIRILDYAI